MSDMPKMPIKKTEQTWYIYLIKTGSGSLYTGITTDVSARLASHQAGKGAKYLRGKGPLQVVAQQMVTGRSLATKVEYQVKQLPPAEKLHLLQNDTLFTDFVRERLAD